jgi:hypothetical protein
MSFSTVSFPTMSDPALPSRKTPCVEEDDYVVGEDAAGVGTEF